MADTSKCFALIRGRVMRVTQLDGCGAKVLGPAASAISDGFISVALTAQVDAGTAISVTNAAGNVCILDTPAPKFTGYDLVIEFCGVNPDLFRLMTGQYMEIDSGGLGIGFRMNSQIDTSLTGFALEVWSNVPSAACVGGVVSYGYFLIPFVKGGVIGDFTIANDAVNFTLTGATSKDGSAWGVGPYNVVLATGVPAPLALAVDDGDHLVMLLTQVPPPAAICGAAALGVPATSAVAGVPGSYLPANSYGRASLTAMTTPTVLTASPASAWTTGQYVVNRDGSTAHWSGTAWITGPA